MDKREQPDSAQILIRLSPTIFVLLWSTGFIGSRLTVPYAEPLSFLFIRFVIVAVVLAGIAWAFSAPWPDRRETVHAIIAGMLIQGVYLGSVFWAIYWGMPAAVAALIVGLQPILTALVAPAVLGEQVSRRHWLGLIIGVIGVAIVLWPRLVFSGEGITPSTALACVVGMAGITIGTVYQKRFIPNLDLRSGNMWQFVGGAAFVGIGALALENFQITWNTPVILAMFWLVFILSIGAISLLYLMIRRGAVSKVAGLFYLVPAVTAVIAWLMFNDSLLIIQIIGMGICAIGVFLATRQSNAG